MIAFERLKVLYLSPLHILLTYIPKVTYILNKALSLIYSFSGKYALFDLNLLGEKYL